MPVRGGRRPPHGRYNRGMARRDWIERRLVRYFEDRPGDVAAVYLFGSVARGTAGLASDIDVGVLLRSAPPPTLEALPLEVEAELEAELGAPVQVVLLNTAPPDLVHRVLRDGRLLVDRHPSARITFEVWARNEYFDVEPYLRRYRRTGVPAGPP